MNGSCFTMEPSSPMFNMWGTENSKPAISGVYFHKVCITEVKGITV